MCQISRIIRICIATIFAVLGVFSVFVSTLQAQSINIGDFYYRDYLDFGQNKGAFSNSNSFGSNGSATLTKKDGTSFSIPNSPNFSASSNYGSLTSIGRGFVVTANHVSSPESIEELRQWGLTKYNLANQPLESNENITGVSKPYGRDEKFLRFNKYIVEGQTSMLDIANSTNTSNPTSTAQESQNLADFKEKIKSLADSSGNVYIYQAGSGIMDLRWSDNPIKNINLPQDGSMKGGGFGILGIDSSGYQNLVYQAGASGDSRGILYFYNPSGDFNNRITSGDSGSGIYAYDSTNQKWILLGVTSRATAGVNRAEVSFVSNKDFEDYQKNFEQKINLKISDNQTNTWTLNGKGNNATLKYEQRGDTPRADETLQGNKDIIFSGGGTIKVENDIDRTVSGYAGGFVFESTSGASSTNPTRYTFTNTNGGNYYFKGSGLDIGENVEVEWHLRNDKNDALHKIGKGTLVIKTDYTPTSTGDNLGYLKIGEGKVTLDTSKKAFEGIYITSGRGSLELKQGKAKALGASKDNGYTLAQSKNSEMGFYFGTNGGKLDLGGNSLTLNTIAANDSGAIITNASTSAKSTLEIQGFGYDSNGNKQNTKADTIIHASIGQAPTSINGTDGTSANIDIVYKGEKNATQSSLRESEANEAIQENGLPRVASNARNDDSSATLIFDGHINTSGKLSAESANIALQGHATAHATISDSSLIEKIKNAENGTKKGIPEYMDLSKPSTLNQPDWDTRYFKFSNGIELKSANLTLGRNAYLESNINADKDSSITFGGSVKHFIDNKDGANINGSGFGYYQKVESGELSAEMQKLANQTIGYKGKITAEGGTIESHIWDFNASLDLKNNAKLNAEYLTLTNSDSVTLASGANATIQNLVLKNVNDLNGKFSVSGNNSAFKVEKSFRFENSNFDLTKLDSINGLTKSNYYDIVGFGSSTITGANKDLSANVELYQGASLSLKSLTLKNPSTDSSDSSAIKNTLYLQGDSNQTSNTKLTLSGDLKVENFDENIKAQIQLDGKSELTAQNIEFSSVKDGILALDKDATLTLNSGNGAVKATNSKLNIYLNGDKTFNLNASGTSSVIFGRFDADSTANFSGKITASDSSVVASALESITASVDLSGSASLSANKITLENTYNFINLNGNSSLNAGTITAKNLTNLTLNVDGSANANVSKFIFDGGENGTTTNLSGNLIGSNIELKNASVVKTSDLTFNSKKDTALTLDSTSKLEANNLNVNNANLILNLADSKENTANLTNIDLKNKASLTIDSWDFGNSTKFTSDSNSSLMFQNAKYAQDSNTSPKSFDSKVIISEKLELTNVGKDLSKNGDERFKSLNFSDSLTFGENAKITVSLDSSISKDSTNLKDTYFTLLGASSILDKRADKRIDFIFADSVAEDKRFFVVSKFFDNELRFKFLDSDPRSFSELNKHISSRYSEILKALTEHNPSDEIIDIAARTEEYAQLESTLNNYQDTMGEIAKQASGENLNVILQNNDLSMRLRVMQARFANSKTPQAHAQNHIKENPILLAKSTKINPANYNTAKSDYISPNDELDSALLLGGVPKPPKISNPNLYNNSAWASVLGGYVGTSGLHNAFYGSSVGYDRIINKTLLGIMASFGGSSAFQRQTKAQGIIASGGVYLHTIFSKSEFSSNLSFAFNTLESNTANDSFKSSSFGGLWSNYYKYNIRLLNGHILKPLALVGVGVNKANDWRGREFRGNGFSDVFANIGAGLEYSLISKSGFYTLGLVGFFKIHSQAKAQITFANAKTMLDFTLNNNAFETQGYFIGSHSLGSYSLQERMKLEYGIYANIDGKGYYGIKGNIVFKYAF